VDRLGSLSYLSAADEVDDFVAVAFLYASLSPLRAREDFEIPFQGDAFGGQAQVGEEFGDAEAFRDLLLFPVDDDFHTGEVFGLARSW